MSSMFVMRVGVRWVDCSAFIFTFLCYVLFLLPNDFPLRSFLALARIRHGSKEGKGRKGDDLSNLGRCNAPRMNGTRVQMSYFPSFGPGS